MVRKLQALCAIAAIFTSTVSASNLSTLQISSNPPAKIEILTGWRESGQHVFGLKMTLARGWKTYWRAPGVNGIAPEIIWSELNNASEPQFHFPEPAIILDELGIFPVIGYKDSVIFPITLSVPNASKDSYVSGIFRFGVCREVCIPKQIEFNTKLAADLDIRIDEITAAQSSAAKKINASTDGEHFICRFMPIGKNEFMLIAEIDIDTHSPTLFEAVPEYQNNRIWFDKTQSELESGGRLKLTSRLTHLDDNVFAIDRSKLTITFITNKSATEYSGCRGSA